MTTQPQSPSEQEIRDCVEQAASTDYKVMCLQALIAQAADKREQEARIDELEKLLAGMVHGLGGVTEASNIVADRLAQLRQGRAAEGEGKL